MFDARFIYCFLIFLGVKENYRKRDELFDEYEFRLRGDIEGLYRVTSREPSMDCNNREQRFFQFNLIHPKQYDLFD